MGSVLGIRSWSFSLWDKIEDMVFAAPQAPKDLMMKRSRDRQELTNNGQGNPS